MKGLSLIGKKIFISDFRAEFYTLQRGMLGFSFVSPITSQIHHEKLGLESKLTFCKRK